MSDRLPPVCVQHPHVEAREDMLGGSPVVQGSRVPVRRLWAWHRKGVSVETLVKRYPALGWAKVLDALAFAYDNEELVEADLDRERAFLESAGRRGDAEPVPGQMHQTKLPFQR
jgi:uncharacterized protein (DUF433 family)